LSDATYTDDTVFADLALLESDQSKLDAIERSELHSILTARSQSDLHLVPKQSRLIMKGYPFERKQCDYDNQKITHLRPVGRSGCENQSS